MIGVTCSGPVIQFSGNAGLAAQNSRAPAMAGAGGRAGPRRTTWLWRAMSMNREAIGFG
jgi:hypothetical protein